MEEPRPVGAVSGAVGAEAREGDHLPRGLSSAAGRTHLVVASQTTGPARLNLPDPSVVPPHQADHHQADLPVVVPGGAAGVSHQGAQASNHLFSADREP